MDDANAGQNVRDLQIVLGGARAGWHDVLRLSAVQEGHLHKENRPSTSVL